MHIVFPVVKLMREKYDSIIKKQTAPRLLVVLIQLPTGAIEVIQNFEELDSKIAYYEKAYDECGIHKSGAGIQILDFLLV